MRWWYQAQDPLGLTQPIPEAVWVLYLVLTVIGTVVAVLNWLDTLIGTPRGESQRRPALKITATYSWIQATLILVAHGLHIYRVWQIDEPRYLSVLVYLMLFGMAWNAWIWRRLAVRAYWGR
jgi:hypothetical protein